MSKYIFETKMEVRDYECDIQGIVNNANYLHYTEHTRHRFLRSLGLSFAKLHEQGVDDPVLEGLDLDLGLLGVDDGDDVPPSHGVAGADEPLDEPAAVHVRAEGGHGERAHQPTTFRAARTMSCTCGIAASSRCLA